MEVTERAREELRAGEALVFDWHRVAICCAAAGEVTLRRTTVDEARRRGFRPLTANGDPPLYAHPRAYPHLAGRSFAVDCKRRLGVRRFTSNLPADFGLRAVLGRLPADSISGGSR